MPQLQLDKLTRKISIHIFNLMRIIFSPGLGNILGYNERKDDVNVYGIPDTVITLHNTYNTGVNCLSLFVHCDILEQVIVGDTKTLLLRSLSISGKHGNIVREIYDNQCMYPYKRNISSRLKSI